MNHFFKRLFRMPAVSGAPRQKSGIACRRGGQGSGQDKTMVDVHESMFFQPEVGLAVFDGPV